MEVGFLSEWRGGGRTRSVCRCARVSVSVTGAPCPQPEPGTSVWWTQPLSRAMRPWPPGPQRELAALTLRFGRRVPSMSPGGQGSRTSRQRKHVSTGASCTLRARGAWRAVGAAAWRESFRKVPVHALLGAALGQRPEGERVCAVAAVIRRHGGTRGRADVAGTTPGGSLPGFFPVGRQIGLTFYV